MEEKIGIFGGTFSPPHRGHMQAVETARAQLGLDRLLLIPAAMPPHKPLPEGTPSPENRLELLRLAAAGRRDVRVLDDELRRGGISYTVDTVAGLREEYPGARLFLLMGGDMFFSLESWRDFEKLASEVVFAPFARTAEERGRILSFAAYLTERYGARVSCVKNEAVEISSTEIRELLPQRKGLSYLEEPVYAYIIKNRLYGARPDWDWLRSSSQKWLKPRRIPHVLGCEEEAVRLARRWGADEDEARTAAILHDITKKFELDDQLILCEKYDIITDTIEKTEKKLLHSKTGAAVAEHEYGVSQAAASAIRWHTTGRADMSLLEKVIYMADYIEPTRDFDGLEPLRAMSYEDLDRALLMGLYMSVEDMTQRGIIPHPRTMEAIACLRGSKGT